MLLRTKLGYQLKETNFPSLHKFKFRYKWDAHQKNNFYGSIENGYFGSNLRRQCFET